MAFASFLENRNPCFSCSFFFLWTLLEFIQVGLTSHVNLTGKPEWVQKLREVRSNCRFVRFQFLFEDFLELGNDKKGQMLLAEFHVVKQKNASTYEAVIHPKNTWTVQSNDPQLVWSTESAHISTDFGHKCWAIFYKPTGHLILSFWKAMEKETLAQCLKDALVVLLEVRPANPLLHFGCIKIFKLWFF